MRGMAMSLRIKDLRLGIAVAVFVAWSAAVAAQGPVFKPGDAGVQPPVIVKQVKPAHTAAVMGEPVEGTVWLRTVVDTKGRPGRIEVLKSVQRSIDSVAVAALAKWRLTPAKKDGKPVAYQFDVHMVFDLRGGRRDPVAECGKAGATNPTMVKDVKPKYTRNAFRDRARGTVELDGIVEIDGTVTSVRLLKPLHPELNVSAVDAFMQSRFKPGMLAGVPVACRVHLEYSFETR